MEIKLNVEAKEQRINVYYLWALDKIAENAEKGIDLTDLTFSNDIFSGVRSKINEHMKAFDIRFLWMSIGNMNSVAVGEGRLMRFKLLS